MMTPTTWNPSHVQPDSSLSGGNKVVTKNSSDQSWTGWTSSSNVIPESNVYWEILVGAAGVPARPIMLGVTVSTAANNYVGSDAAGWGYYSDLYRYHSASEAPYGNGFGVGDRIGFAFNKTSGSLYVSKNGVWESGSNPVADTSPMYTGISGRISPSASTYGTGQVLTCAFSVADLFYSPPSGYVAFDLGTEFVYPEATLMGGLVNIFDQVAPTTPTYALAPQTSSLRDMGFFSGNYKIAGTVKEAGSPDLAVQRLVRLHRKIDGMFLKAVWSNLDGTYLFSHIALDQYYVTSHDHNGNFNAVIKDSITSVPV